MNVWASWRTVRYAPPTITAFQAGPPVANSVLHFDGTDTSTVFPDTGADLPAHTWTAGGNVQLDTAQAKFGSASALFDGAGDHIDGDGGDSFAFGSSDFTIHFWFQVPLLPGAQNILYDTRPNGSPSGSYQVLSIVATNVVQYDIPGGSSITGTTTITASQWQHYAVTRSGGTTRLFLDGVQQGSDLADPTVYLIGASRPILGIDGNNVSGSPYKGWIDELIIYKGAALWTSNFTPPTTPYG